MTKSNGTFTVSQINTEVELPANVPQQITGRWGLTADDNLWVVTLITPEVAAQARLQELANGSLPNPSEVNRALILGITSPPAKLDCSTQCSFIPCLCGFKPRRRED